jgi:hypothetical protein
MMTMEWTTTPRTMVVGAEMTATTEKHSFD